MPASKRFDSDDRTPPWYVNGARSLHHSLVRERRITTTTVSQRTLVILSHSREGRASDS
jgi:hypothetical protein